MLSKLYFIDPDSFPSTLYETEHLSLRSRRRLWNQGFLFKKTIDPFLGQHILFNKGWNHVLKFGLRYEFKIEKLETGQLTITSGEELTLCK